MPRLPRRDHDAARHHVMSRGARKSAIFHDSDDCVSFLGLLAELPARYGMRVHAFALMPNHFHLLVESSRSNLSEAMRFLCGQHARRFNARYSLDGPVFRGRFKSLLVEDDTWWAHLLAYLHLNPVRARLATSADDARWTSHPYYAGLAIAPEWLTTEELCDIFGDADTYRTYVEEVQMGRETGPEGFDPATLWTAAAHQPSVKTSAPPVPSLLDPQVALGQVMVIAGVGREQLQTFTRGGHGNRAAWLAAWWLCRRTGLSQTEVGRLLGCNQTGVSQRVRHLREHLAEDAQLRGWVERLQEVYGEYTGPSTLSTAE